MYFVGECFDFLLKCLYLLIIVLLVLLQDLVVLLRDELLHLLHALLDSFILLVLTLLLDPLFGLFAVLEELLQVGDGVGQLADLLLEVQILRFLLGE